MRNRAWKALALVTLIGLAATGCGDDEADGSVATATPESTTTTVAAEPALPDEIGPLPDMGTGDVEVTLHWTGGHDLTLAVVEPDGSVLDGSQQTSPSGGQYEDEFPSCSEPQAVAQNAYWATGTAPSGDYEAQVRNHKSCGGDATYRLDIRVGGEVVSSETGTISPGPDTEFQSTPFQV